MSEPTIAIVKIENVQHRDADTYFFRWEDGWKEWIHDYLDGFDSETKPLTVSIIQLTEQEFRELMPFEDPDQDEDE